MHVRRRLKQIVGRVVHAATGRLAYADCVFMLAHMRCGSTALSNILCSHPAFNGYGETHVHYSPDTALGRLTANLWMRSAWSRKAEYTFDKILHSRLHEEAPADFYDARAIFVLREPAQTIRSISALYEKLDRRQYRSLEAAARYYVERLETLEQLWDQFPPQQRIAMTHKGLLQDPDGALAALSDHFSIKPPLINQYQSKAASRKGGGGDPLVSGKHQRIEPTLLQPSESIENLDLPEDLARCAQEQFVQLRSRLAKDWPKLMI